jgi:dipeptidyl aminopeptidase/acylaminoacyl peptidase
LTAAKDRRIKALVTWATPCYLGELFRGDVIEGLEKLRQDVRKYDVVKALKETRCPILIVHGSLDEIVPLSHAKVLYENAKEPKNIQIIEGGDHRLTDSSHRGRAVELTLEWFKKYLK